MEVYVVGGEGESGMTISENPFLIQIILETVLNTREVTSRITN